jgi:hypothetical protein
MLKFDISNIIQGSTEFQLEVGKAGGTVLLNFDGFDSAGFVKDAEHGASTPSHGQFSNLHFLQQSGDGLIQLYHNFISDFETKINLLKLAQFAVVVSRQYSEKDAAIAYLEQIVEKLKQTKQARVEEPILYVKMQVRISFPGPCCIHL